MKDIGDKRKKRAKTVRNKMIKRKNALQVQTKEKRKQESLAHKSRRKQMPIKNARDIIVNTEHLERNIKVLEGMMDEFVKLEELRKKATNE